MTLNGTFSPRSPLPKRTWRHYPSPGTLLLTSKVRMLPQGYGIWLKRQPVLGFRESTGPLPAKKRKFFSKREPLLLNYED